MIFVRKNSIKLFIISGLLFFFAPVVYAGLGCNAVSQSEISVYLTGCPNPGHGSLIATNQTTGQKSDYLYCGNNWANTGLSAGRYYSYNGVDSNGTPRASAACSTLSALPPPSPITPPSPPSPIIPPPSSPPPATGDIVISVSGLNDNKSVFFSVSGRENFSGSIDNSLSPTLYAGKLTGTYIITWNAVSGYTTPPSQTQTLSSGGSITFNGNYVAISSPIISPGTIIISPSINSAGWDLVGPSPVSGTGNATFTDRTSGDYIITWNAVSGYITPPSQTQTLSSGGSITFNGNYVAIVASPAPINNNPQITATSVNPAIPLDCNITDSRTSLRPILNWIYSDADGDMQTSYRVIVKRGSTTIKDSGKVTSASNYYEIPSGLLNYNSNYTWTIQVWDAKGGASEIVSVVAFSTIRNDLPSVSFEYFPKPILPDINTQFCSKKEGKGCITQLFTETFCSGVCKNWSWSLPPGASFISPSGSSSKNPIIKFIKGDGQSILLKVTDNRDYSCSTLSVIGVGFPLPQFREKK